MNLTNAQKQQLKQIKQFKKVASQVMGNNNEQKPLHHIRQDSNKLNISSKTSKAFDRISMLSLKTIQVSDNTKQNKPKSNEIIVFVKDKQTIANDNRVAAIESKLEAIRIQKLYYSSKPKPKRNSCQFVDYR